MSIDTLRADHLGVYGYGRGTSPNLDRFANSAVLFEHAISSSHNTAPAHMSIFTGLAPSVHRIVNCVLGCKMTQRLAPQMTTLAQLLVEQGYATAGFHGGGNVSDRLGFGRGFDLYTSKVNWRQVHDKPTELGAIRRWIRTQKANNKPLFLFLHHYICHDPYLKAPQSFRRRFLSGKRVPNLPTSMSEIDTTKGQRRLSFWRNIRLEDPKHRQHVVGLYDAEVSYSDYLFAEVSKLLRAEGIYDDAVLIVLSDHGEEFFEHHGRLHERLFVELLHVPLLIKFPHDRHGGRHVKQRVGTIDLMPTVMDLLGVKHGLDLQGVSFMPLLEGDPRGYRPSIVSYSGGFQALRFQRNGWTYSSQELEVEGQKVTDWLFDKQDPREKRNLAGDKPAVVRAMREHVQKLQRDDEQFRETLLTRTPRRTRQRKTRTKKETLERQLRSLGYIE